MILGFLRSIAATAALLLFTAAEAAPQHYEIYGRVASVYAFSATGQALDNTNSVFTSYDLCTLSFDYDPTRAVDLNPSDSQGIYTGALTNLRLSAKDGAYVATVGSSDFWVDDESTFYSADTFFLNGPLQNAQFPNVDGYRFEPQGNPLLVMTDYTRQALTSDAAPATISPLFFNDPTPAVVNLHFVDPSGSDLFVAIQFYDQAIRPPSSYVVLSAQSRDNAPETLYLSMGAIVNDPVHGGPIEAIKLIYPDGTAVGSRPGGYSSGGGGTRLAGDSIANRREIQNGAYTFGIVGGLRDGLVLTYNVDRSLLPLLPPRLLASSQYALEHNRGDRPITIHFWPFLDRRRALPATCSLTVTTTGTPKKTVYTTPIAPDAVSTTIPANTLGAGTYEVRLSHTQTGPASKDGLAPEYVISGIFTITRQR